MGFNSGNNLTSDVSGFLREACICKACIMCFVCELYVAWKDCICNHLSCLYLFLNIIDRFITNFFAVTQLFIIVLYFTETSADQEQVEDLHHMSEHHCLNLRHKCWWQEGLEFRRMDPKLLYYINAIS